MGHVASHVPVDKPQAPQVSVLTLTALACFSLSPGHCAGVAAKWPVRDQSLLTPMKLLRPKGLIWKPFTLARIGW